MRHDRHLIQRKEKSYLQSDIKDQTKLCSSLAL